MTTSHEIESGAREPKGLLAPLVRLWRRSRFANRRRFRRYSVHTAVDVTFDGRSQACEIVNISSGGALLLPVLSCPIGTRVSLKTPMLPTPLVGEVVSQAEKGTGIQFDSTLTGSFATLWLNSIHSVLHPESKR